MKEYGYHEAANIWPLASKKKIDEIADSIKESGQEFEIEIYEDQILDGRCRYLACKIAGVEPRFIQVNPLDVVAHVLIRNQYRRHSSLNQLAISAGKAAKLWSKYKEEGEKEQEEAGIHGSEGGRGKKKPLRTVGLKGNRAPQSRDKLGKDFGISGRSAERGKNIVQKGVPEISDAVLEKKVSLQKGEEIAKLPVKEQGAALEISTRPKVVKKKPEQKKKKGDDLKLVGKGILLARKAVDILSRIPKNDALREQGFKLVSKWLREHK